MYMLASYHDARLNPPHFPRTFERTLPVYRRDQLRYIPRLQFGHGSLRASPILIELHFELAA